MEIFSIYDQKAKHFNPPMSFTKKSDVQEHFTDYFRLEEAQKINHVEYDLFYLGNFDMSTGHFNLEKHPEHICSMAKFVMIQPEEVEFLKKEEEEEEEEQESEESTETVNEGKKGLEDAGQTA